MNLLALGPGGVPAMQSFLDRIALAAGITG
jgi:hypothetical protein